MTKTVSKFDLLFRLGLVTFALTCVEGRAVNRNTGMESTRSWRLRFFRMDVEDLWTVLGVKHDAKQAEIKDAYRENSFAVLLRFTENEAESIRLLQKLVEAYKGLTFGNSPDYEGAVWEKSEGMNSDLIRSKFLAAMQELHADGSDYAEPNSVARTSALLKAYSDDGLGGKAPDSNEAILTERDWNAALYKFNIHEPNQIGLALTSAISQFREKMKRPIVADIGARTIESFLSPRFENFLSSERNKFQVVEQVELLSDLAQASSNADETIRRHVNWLRSAAQKTFLKAAEHWDDQPKFEKMFLKIVQAFGNRPTREFVEQVKASAFFKGNYYSSLAFVENLFKAGRLTSLVQNPTGRKAFLDLVSYGLELPPSELQAAFRALAGELAREEKHYRMKLATRENVPYYSECLKQVGEFKTEMRTARKLTTVCGGRGGLWAKLFRFAKNQ